MVKVSFYGAAGEVTGSNFLIDTAEHKYVVDCGLFQGGDVFTEHNEQPFAYDPSQLQAVMITHAHLDHIGRLPMLVKNGFRGPIYATAATIELAGITLKDALGIMLHRQTMDGKAPLYDEADLKRTLNLFRAVPYHQPQALSGQDVFTLYDAGHILGSASILLEADGKKLVFSGDIGHWPNSLLPHAETPLEADLVVTEATYGGVDRPEPQNRLTVIKDALEWTIQNRGVLLIPAFAVERSQELLYLLNYLSYRHQLPKIPIYLDSPLAIEALQVFKRHEELFAAEVQKLRRVENDIFLFKGLVLAPTTEDSKDINEQAPPKVIIAGSGMMQGGRIHHHLRRYLPSPKTLLLVIGYQAEHTLGRQIVNGATQVDIMGAPVSVRAQVKVLDIFSGHADNQELLKWLTAINYRPGAKLMVVHSAPERAAAMAKELTAALPAATTAVAEINGQLTL